MGSVTDQYKQVGNAVPGKMAKAVARALSESLRFVYDEETETKEESPLVAAMDEDTTESDDSKDDSVDGRAPELEEAKSDVFADTKATNEECVGN